MEKQGGSFIINADRTLTACRYDNKLWEQEMWVQSGTILETPARIASGLVELLEALEINDFTLGITRQEEGYRYWLIPNFETMTYGQLTETAKRVKSYISMT